MRSFRLSRKQHHGDPGEESEPLGKLRRRCAAGAMGASTVYLGVLITTAVRPSTIGSPVAIGLLIAFGTAAALCTLGAMLISAEARIAALFAAREEVSRREVDDIDWAIHFGAELAEAFPDRGLGNVVPRGPSIR